MPPCCACNARQLDLAAQDAQALLVKRDRRRGARVVIGLRHAAILSDHALVVVGGGEESSEIAALLGAFHVCYRIDHGG